MNSNAASIFASMPLVWLGWKRRVTQFSDNKNTPGIDYVALKVQREEMLKASAAFDEAATTPGPEETNEGDFKRTRVLVIDDGLQNSVPAGIDAGQGEVS